MKKSDRGRLEVFDLQSSMAPWEDRHAEGKAVRKKIPRESHASWTAPKSRLSPLDILRSNNVGRQTHLIPLRIGRMAGSPFAFLRGAACVMAADLAGSPVSGFRCVIDGDAHINNFGMYGTPQRDIVFDLNDFDEATIGPWEWDLKRLVASVNVGGRQNGLNVNERAIAVKHAVRGYRENVRRLESMGVLDVWYLHAYPGRQNPLVKVDPKFQAVVKKTLSKALRSDNHALLPKMADQVNGSWHFRNFPPVLTTVDPKTRKKVIEGLNRYALNSLSPERRLMLGRYHVADVAHRVVGVGSVGTRAYLALLFGNDLNDPLFLQVKEATRSAHAPYLLEVNREFAHNGKRVVMGQRALQASSDPMLGYTEIDGRDYFVRQMKNLKASIPVEYLTGTSFNFYGWACGAILSRAHARTSDPARIAGYCGNSSVLDDSLAEWAELYGNQTEEDHGELVKAIKSGKIQAIQDTSEAG